MTQPKKIVYGVIASVCAVLILMFAAVILVPKLVDTEVVREKLRSEIKLKSGADVDFKQLELDFFPRPHIVFEQATLAIPPNVKGKAASVGVFLNILPLFLGKLEVTNIHLDSPKLDYIHPVGSDADNQTSQPLSLHELKRKMHAIISTLAELKTSNLDLRVNNASVNLFAGKRKLLQLTQLELLLEGPPVGRKLTLSCKSDVWQEISMSGLLNTATSKGSGRIQLMQFQPQQLIADLFPDSALQITHAPADITIDVTTDEPGQLQVELNGSTPHLKLSANLAVTDTDPLVSMKINGSQIDVASIRPVALALSAKDGVVSKIFEIVQGGRLQSISLKTEGKLFKDLGRADNMEIRGEMQDGAIHVPAMQFDLKDVSGEFVIAHGILEGKNLQASMGSSRGKNGELRMGLMKNAAPFHLQTDLRADLSQLPAILKRLVKEKDVLDELALLKAVKGSASAKLLLDEVAGKMKLKVDASDVHLSADYARLSHPLQFTAGSISYDEQRIALKSAHLAWNDMRLKVSGSIKPRAKKRMWLDLDVSTNALNLAPLIQGLNTTGAHKRGAKIAKSEPLPLKGKIRFKAGRLNIGKLSWKPVHADISLKSGTAHVSINKANICGVSTPATLKISPPHIEFKLEAAASHHELSHSGRCFLNEEFKADGRYNLKGSFRGSGKAQELLKKTTGEVELTATDGHIYHDAILISVLKFLNTLEVLAGKVNFEDMGKKGFGFHAFRLKAKLHNGKLRYEEAVLRGHPMTITAAGEQDLSNGRINFTMLVAPLVTLNRVFEHIPLIGGALETLDTIPLSVKGTSGALHTFPLAPSAIGYELQEMMKKSVNRPIKLIHPDPAS